MRAAPEQLSVPFNKFILIQRINLKGMMSQSFIVAINVVKATVDVLILSSTKKNAISVNNRSDQQVYVNGTKGRPKME